MVMPREERPPYISFELRSVEDRAQSIAQGHWVGRDVPFVIITPPGSKDRIERNAIEWLANQQRMADEGRLPMKWYRSYKEHFEAWKKDEEPALDGSPIRNWPVVSPSQYKLLRDLRVLTVEDLASANEETLARIGPGGRSLKAKAEEWLLQARTFGIPSERLNQLETDNASLRAVNEQLQADRDNMKGQLTQVLANTATVVNGAQQTTSAPGVSLDMEDVLSGELHSS